MPKLLCEFDKKGAEWVVVGYLSGDANMLSVIENKKDPHLITGQLLTGLKPELIKQENKLFSHLTDAVELEQRRRSELPEIFRAGGFLPRNMTVRQAGKKTNHSGNYKIGPDEFALKTEMDFQDSKRTLEIYSGSAYPGISVWWETTERKLKADRTMVNCFGRVRRFLGPWNNALVKEALAYVPQSTIADLTRIAMVKSYDNKDLMRRADILTNVYDSLLFQLDCNDWHRAALDCQLIGLNYFNAKCHYGGRDFYVDTELKVGLSWGKMVEVALTNDTDKLASELKKTWQAFSAERQVA